MKKKESLFNKKAMDLTVAESLKLSGLITVVCMIPTIVVCWDDIKDWFSEKFIKENK